MSPRLVQEYALAYPALRFSCSATTRRSSSRPAPASCATRSARSTGPRLPAPCCRWACCPTSEPALSDDPFADWDDPTRLPGPRRAVPAAPRAGHAADGHAVQVWGYVSPPAISRTNRQAQHFFVNGRAINSRMLTFALEEAYHSLLMVSRHPVAVLNVRVDPGGGGRQRASAPRARSSSARSARCSWPCSGPCARRWPRTAPCPASAPAAPRAGSWPRRPLHPGLLAFDGGRMANGADEGSPGLLVAQRQDARRPTARPATRRDEADAEGDLFGRYAAPAWADRATRCAHRTRADAARLMPAPRTTSAPARRCPTWGRCPASAAACACRRCA